MKKELEAFENRTDDWLAKERAYEETISAWDLDEAKKIKKMHEQRHSSYDATHPKGLIKANKQFDDINSKLIIKFVLEMAIVAVVIFALAILLQFNVIGEEFAYIIPILIFIVFTSLLPKKGGKK